MRFSIIHEIKGRMRIHAVQNRMTCKQADTLYYYLNKQEFITSAKIRERTQDITVTYTCGRDTMIDAFKNFSYKHTQVPANLIRSLQ